MPPHDGMFSMLMVCCHALLFAGCHLYSGRVVRGERRKKSGGGGGGGGAADGGPSLGDFPQLIVAGDFYQLPPVKSVKCMPPACVHPFPSQINNNLRVNPLPHIAHLTYYRSANLPINADIDDVTRSKARLYCRSRQSASSLHIRGVRMYVPNAACCIRAASVHQLTRTVRAHGRVHYGHTDSQFFCCPLQGTRQKRTDSAAGLRVVLP